MRHEDTKIGRMLPLTLTRIDLILPGSDVYTNTEDLLI